MLSGLHKRQRKYWRESHRGKKTKNEIGGQKKWQ